MTGNELMDGLMAPDTTDSEAEAGDQDPEGALGLAFEPLVLEAQAFARAAKAPSTLRAY